MTMIVECQWAHYCPQMRHSFYATLFILSYHPLFTSGPSITEGQPTVITRTCSVLRLLLPRRYPLPSGIDGVPIDTEDELALGSILTS
jgi:hypothetical protein